MRRITVAGIRNRAKREVAGAVLRLGILPDKVDFGPAPHNAAGFAKWLRRRERRIGSDVALGWREHRPAEKSEARLAVVLHVFDGDTPEAVVARLGTIPVRFDLFVTGSVDPEAMVADPGLPALGRRVHLPARNQGRSLLPLVSAVNAELLDDYELLLVLNTATDLDELLGSRDEVERILTAFASDPALGSVSPQGSVRGEESWGENREIVAALLQRLQLGLDGRELQFASGAAYWMRGFVVQGLRALEMSEWDFEDEFGQTDGTTAHALERTIGLLTREAGYDLREASALGESTDGWSRYAEGRIVPPRARLVALYAPEFHSEVGPDGWSASGASLWADIASAQPVIKGHSQPLLPRELGFYDLSAPGVIPQQYAIAHSAGVEAFMFNYYWEDGGKRLQGPLEAHVAGSSPDPFCILWNNDRFLDGTDKSKTPERIAAGEASRFFDEVLPLLADPRYVRIDGRPVLAVSHIDHLENLEDVLLAWRRKAENEGLPGIHVLALDEGSRSESAMASLMASGPDGVMALPPRKSFLGALADGVVGVSSRFHGTIRRYDLLADHVERGLLREPKFLSYPVVTVNYDNTPAKRWFSDILIGANPYTFRRWLDAAAASVAHREHDDRMIFVSSWNDWSVSAVLEPSRRFGKTYLLAVKDALFR